LQLEVDIGIERRLIISGISNCYTLTELVGKKIIVVANLKPAEFLGLESHGMVLAGKLDAQLELATILDLPVGSIVA
jgi:methionyl-tRNA synthetase